MNIEYDGEVYNIALKAYEFKPVDTRFMSYVDELIGDESRCEIDYFVIEE